MPAALFARYRFDGSSEFSSHFTSPDFENVSRHLDVETGVEVLQAKIAQHAAVFRADQFQPFDDHGEVRLEAVMASEHILLIEKWQCQVAEPDANLRDGWLHGWPLAIFALRPGRSVGLPPFEIARVAAVASTVYQERFSLCNRKLEDGELEFNGELKYM